MESTEVLKILGLCSFIGSPPDKIIAKAKIHYKKLAKKYHPDVGGDHNLFLKLSEAWSALRSPEGLAYLDQEYRKCLRGETVDIQYTLDEEIKREERAKQAARDKARREKQEKLEFALQVILDFLRGQSACYPFDLRILKRYTRKMEPSFVTYSLKLLLKAGYIERLSRGVYIRSMKSIHYLLKSRSSLNTLQYEAARCDLHPIVIYDENRFSNKFSFD